MQFKNYTIDIQKSENGFEVSVRSASGEEEWSSTEVDINKVVSAVDKVFLWSLELYESRHSEERAAFKKELRAYVESQATQQIG